MEWSGTARRGKKGVSEEEAERERERGSSAGCVLSYGGSPIGGSVLWPDSLCSVRWELTKNNAVHTNSSGPA